MLVYSLTGVYPCLYFSAQLKIAQVDLAAVRNHMQQFQEISQANEAALAALNTTHDEYKADAETQLARQEVRVLYYRA